MDPGYDENTPTMHTVFDIAAVLWFAPRRTGVGRRGARCRVRTTAAMRSHPKVTGNAGRESVEEEAGVRMASLP